MNNKIARPVLITWVTLIILLSASFIKLPIVPRLNNYSSIDLLKDIRDTKPQAAPIAKAKILPTAPTTASMANISIQLPNAGDSSMIADYAEDSATMMLAFYKKLANLKHTKGKVRIAYFGDSFIEADYITDGLRARLQQSYGGNGIGFVPVQSIVADSYTSIRFASNKSWTDYHFHNNVKKLALGLTGHVFYSTGNSWCEYGAKKNTFPNIYLYTGKAGDTVHKVNIERDGAAADIVVNNANYINQTVLNNAAPIKKFKLNCADKDLPVYGISIEDSSGVYIDNYAFRGNTGLLGLQVPEDIVAGFKNYFNYDLVIVHYGLNAVVHNDFNYSWFDRGMSMLVEKIKKEYPGVPILMISTSDIAYNNNGQYVTDPVVPILVQTQNENAKKNKVAFWNLYYAMGGANTIANWAGADTALAYKDYMHVNERGADKIAGIFFDKLTHFQKN